MDADTLATLLGRKSTDPEIDAVLHQFGVARRPELGIDPDDADGPVADSQDWVSNLSGGIEFGFQEEGAFMGLGRAERTVGPMILTEVYFYGERSGTKPYAGPLPFGLSLRDSREVARSKMAPYERTRRSYVRDTWEHRAFRVTVSYGNGGSHIDFVVCMLREELEPSAASDRLLPTPAQMSSLLGSDITSPGVREVLRALGSERIRRTNGTQEIIDMRRTRGARLHFHRDANAIPALVLRQVEYLRNGELESRGWPGLLPFGLAFDDSPETVIAKVGSAPQKQEDQDFTGEAYWEFPDYSLSVTYSTMENLVLRVSLFASERTA